MEDIMKRITVVALAIVMLLSCVAFGGCGKEETYRLEAEYVNITNGRLDTKDLVSNGFFVVATGHGFKPAELDPLEIDFAFNSKKAVEATIIVCVASGNTFGNPFDLTDADYTFSMNGEALGKPVSVVDYQGNPTTNVPKEDFTEGTGFVYFTYNVKLNKGENHFKFNYTPGNGAFKVDYIDITAKSEITYNPNTDAVTNYEPMF